MKLIRTILLVGLSILFSLETARAQTPSPKGGLGRPARAQPSPTFNAQKLPKLAVLVFAGGGNSLSNPQARLIEDEFLFSLLGKGYLIASRSDLAAVTKEIAFQQSGLTDGDAAKLGKLLNVPAVLIVSSAGQSSATSDSGAEKKTVPGYAPIAPKKRVEAPAAAVIPSMTARLVSAEGAEILWMGKQSGDNLSATDQNPSHVMEALARSISEVFPARKSSSP